VSVAVTPNGYADSPVGDRYVRSNMLLSSLMRFSNLFMLQGTVPVSIKAGVYKLVLSLK
jgi:hypothetical protein